MACRQFFRCLDLELQANSNSSVLTKLLKYTDHTCALSPRGTTAMAELQTSLNNSVGMDRLHRLRTNNESDWDVLVGNLAINKLATDIRRTTDLCLLD